MSILLKASLRNKSILFSIDFIISLDSLSRPVTPFFFAFFFGESSGDLLVL